MYVCVLATLSWGSTHIVSPSACLLCLLQGTGLKMVNTLLAHCPSSVNCVGSRGLAPLHFAAFMVHTYISVQCNLVCLSLLVLHVPHSK